MLQTVIDALFGSKSEADLKALLPLLHTVNAAEPWAMSLEGHEFPRQTAHLKERLAGGASLDDLLAEAFALVREAARRTLGERLYDVQVLGGIVLHQGKIMEMKTGEGKTVSSVTAAYLNALTGKGVHVITVNDYLAERDAKWMQPVYDYLGISVGAILSNMDNEARKEAYRKDITYGTNNEFGFDYLRDNMRFDSSRKVQTGHHFCIIDEIDSILVDEARTPLIISGPAEDDTRKYNAVNRVVPGLVECAKDPETGDYPEEPVGDYKLDEKSKRVSFTEEGLAHLESSCSAPGDHGQPLRGRQLRVHSPRHAGSSCAQPLPPRPAVRRRGRQGRNRRRVHRVAFCTAGGTRTGCTRRSRQGRHQDRRAQPHARHDHLPELLPHVREDLRHDRYRRDRGEGVRQDLRARRRRHPDKPTARSIDQDDVIYVDAKQKFDAICDEIERL